MHARRASATISAMEKSGRSSVWVRSTVGGFSSEFLGDLIESSQCAREVSSAADQGIAWMKADREEYFPIELIHLGISFRCQDGKASVEADRLKDTLLNNTIH